MNCLSQITKYVIIDMSIKHIGKRIILGVQVRNVKMDLITGGIWCWIGLNTNDENALFF